MLKHIILSRYRIVVASVKKISPQEAEDKGLFGPVYHGSSKENRSKIEQEGFKIFIGKPRSDNTSHGYMASDYSQGKPAPIHHLGFGIYFTTVKAIGKHFNNGSAAGLKEYYLDVPRLSTINFGSPNTMMKWWVDNGYNIEKIYPTKLSLDQIEENRLEATKNLTNTLKSKYDAVWFKGKGIRKLLDGDQICIFDPSHIYEIDKSLTKAGDIGSLVKRKTDGMVGTILDRQDASGYRETWSNHSPNDPHPWLDPKTKTIFHVKWEKGGTEYNVQDLSVECITK